MNGFPLLTALTILLAITAGDQQKIIFAVRGEWMDPVAFVVPRVKGVEFQAPRDEAAFAARYYRKGTTYRLFRGGVPDGAVRIDGEEGCNAFQVRATRLDGGKANAIAVGSLDVRPHATPPRAPTADELKELLDVARAAFRLKAVDAAAMKQRDIVAADFDGDGRADFAGAFTVEDPREKALHILFLLVTHDRAGAPRVETLWYNRERTDIDSMAQSRNWAFIDNEDFDGDGVDEIIVAQNGWEWTSYKILQRKREGVWEVVYEGGGSGC